MAVRSPQLDTGGAIQYNADAFREGSQVLSRGAGAQVAQLVEHVTENHGVGGSIPPLGTILATRASPA